MKSYLEARGFEVWEFKSPQGPRYGLVPPGEFMPVTGPDSHVLLYTEAQLKTLMN